jgi:amino acid transporter
MSNTVALDFGRRVFGAVGGSLFAAMVAISCFGALNGAQCLTVTHPTYSRISNPLGSTFTSARLIYVAAKEGYLPQLFGRIHKTRGTPLNAMLLQGGLTMFFIVFGGGFRSLINFAVVASWA